MPLFLFKARHLSPAAAWRVARPLASRPSSLVTDFDDIADAIPFDDDVDDDDFS